MFDLNLNLLIFICLLFLISERVFFYFFYEQYKQHGQVKQEVEEEIEHEASSREEHSLLYDDDEAMEYFEYSESAHRDWEEKQELGKKASLSLIEQIEEDFE